MNFTNLIQIVAQGLGRGLEEGKMVQSRAEIPLQVKLSSLQSSKFRCCKTQPARPNGLSLFAKAK